MNILLVYSFNSQKYDHLLAKANLPDLEIICCGTLEEALQEAGNANILLASPERAREVIDGMTRLQWVQSTWAGVNKLMESGLRKDYLLTGVKGVFGPIMTEYVFCYILVHSRNVLKCYEMQNVKRWDMPMPTLLRGKKIGIMGVGSIGSSIARTAKIFGMSTHGYTRSPSEKRDIDRVFGPDQILEFVSELDYLISVLPDTPQTDHLINSEVLRAMKPEALFINVGRGNVVNEEELIKALREKKIAGAVLDVFQEEPLPKSHPFWDIPEVIVTSHKAALSYPEDIIPLFIENYSRFISGKKLRHLIDFTAGY